MSTTTNSRELGVQEREALALYEEDGRKKFVDSTEIWVDGFSHNAFSSLPPAPKVIDVGCGFGRFVPLVHHFGVTNKGYLGVDFSKEQVKLARSLHPRFMFEECNIFDVGQRYPKKFDGFICTAVIMHIPRDCIKEALESLRECLKDDATGLLSTPLGSGEVVRGNGLKLTLFEILELKIYLRDCGFGSNLFSPYGDMILGHIWTL